MSEIKLFDVAGEQCRFGISESGRAYVVASDFAKRLGYRDARDALRNVDAAERGTQIVRTPGGDQAMGVLYEEGIWELIFLSRRPEARSIKAHVKGILRTIRETGRYEVAELDELEVARRYVQALESKKALEARVAELEPSAAAWDHLASGDGDWSVSDAAKILTRDPNITVGQNRLFSLLFEWKWLFRGGDGRPRAMQSQVDCGRLSEIPQSHYHPRTGELVLDPPQVRIKPKGLAEIHRRMNGAAPLAIPQRA